ncbi:ABC transporter ATP-binding protein [Nonomuraea mesophila]|uniref:ABC transporter ATP-binding protein n=1 Tax=Nonomuraea mesophila TaxID=2530382 RepID=A0A4R5FDV6_9ACTN|nr:ABC transporter ATP-binding protein [Nonomuraea mesophila]TDE47927.1 ABC transporter ATP-binding protein [Nonomuraea mesophila]
MNRLKVLLRTMRLMATLAPGKVLAAALLAVAGALLPAASVAILSWSLQLLVEEARGGSGAWTGGATVAVLALATASTLTFLFAVGQRYNETLLRQRLGNAVIDRVLAKVLTLELRHFEDAAVYDSLERAKAGARSRPHQVFAGLLATVSSLVTIGSVAALLLSWSPLAAALMLVSPAPLAIAQVVHHRTRWRVEYARSADQRRLFYLEYLLTNDKAYKEIRLFGLGPLFRRRYAAVVDGFYDVDRRLEGRHAVACALLAMCGAVAVGLALLLMVQDAVRTGQAGQFAGYVTSVVLIQTSMRAFFEGVAKLYDDSLYLCNLFEFLDLPVQERRPSVAPFPGSLRKGIEFRDVSFTYPGTDTPVLDHFNLFLPAGRCVALVGANGAGKSTIVKLLTRFYEPTEGVILVDDVPLAAYGLDDLRKHVSVMFQDFMEYEAPARENIGFGRVENMSDRPGVRRAAERAGALSFLDPLPSGLDTTLGRWFEGGRELSGGQWQKVALARTFFRAAAINVLDEPAAAIDAAAEAELFARLTNAAARSTTLLIAHRFSTVRAAADHIVVIDAGRVVEEGGHHELIATGGLYARLFRLQAAGYQDEPSDAVPR